jgi:hypothetical protein
MASKPSWLDDESPDNAPAVSTTVTKQQQSIDDENAPDWAKNTWEDRPSGPVPDKDPEIGKPSPTPDAPSRTTSTAELSPEDVVAMNRYHMYLKIGYMGAALLMAISAGLSLTGQSDIGKAFFGIYVIFFCAMICCFEVGLSFLMKYLAVNFGFLYTMPGRTFFVLFLGFMSYSLGVLGIISMGVLVGVLLMHYIVRCRYPQFESYMRKKDYNGK